MNQFAGVHDRQRVAPGFLLTEYTGSFALRSAAEQPVERHGSRVVGADLAHRDDTPRNSLRQAGQSTRRPRPDRTATRSSSARQPVAPQATGITLSPPRTSPLLARLVLAKLMKDHTLYQLYRLSPAHWGERLDLKTGLGARGGIRTHEISITNRVLAPPKLPWHLTTDRPRLCACRFPVRTRLHLRLRPRYRCPRLALRVRDGGAGSHDGRRSAGRRRYQP